MNRLLHYASRQLLSKHARLDLRAPHRLTRFATFRVKPFNSTQFSTLNSQRYSSANSTPASRAKMRRAYALGGCLMFLWISTHGILLYKRQSEHHALNAKLPPISWEEFEEVYFSQISVKTIIFQPQFEVANVYLFSSKEQLMKKQVVDFIRTTPDKFSRPPDVRFFFEGSADELRKLITEASNKYKVSVEFEMDQFPSYRELSFIIISSLFAMAAVALVK